MKPLTDAERRGLHQASRKLGATICPRGKKLTKGTVTKVIADRLVDAGYATMTNGYLRITDAGSHALTAPVEEQALFLARRMQRGYTTDAADGVPGEGQVMGEPSESWRTAEKEATAAAKTATREGRRAEAARLARLARQPGHRNWPTSAPAAPMTTRHDQTVIRPPTKRAA